jgi:hypothetical protein
MTSPKVLQLMKKYADEGNQPTVMLEQSEGRFTHQRKKLEEFSHHLQTKLRVVISEMEHDISVLKMRDFDKNMWKLLVGVWQHLESIYKTFHQDRPYDTAKKIIDYTNDRNTRAIIENLDFLGKDHVKKTNVDFAPTPNFINPEIRSLKLLLTLSNYVENYIKENPLMEKVKNPMLPRAEMPTWQPPATPQPNVPEVVE